MASVNEDREGKRKAEGKQELSVEGTVLPHTCHSHTWPGRLTSHVRLRRLVKAKLTDIPFFQLFGLLHENEGVWTECGN